MTKERVFGVSKRGRSHRRLCLPNQDAFRIYRLDSSISLLVVSDGMGSMKYARKGAVSCCRAVKNAVVKFLKTNEKKNGEKVDLLSLVFEEWKKEIHPYIPEECGATCLFAIIKDKKCMAFSLGDGMIYIKGKNKEKLLADEKSDAFMNTTVSLCTPDCYKFFKTVSFVDDEIEGIVITTDGITSGLEDGTEKEFGHTLLSALKNEKCKKRYLKNFIREWSRLKHSDDKTIVVYEGEK